MRTGSICKWLIAALITVAVTGNLFADEKCTDTFGSAYNKIIQGYEERGGNLCYARKGDFDVVTCADRDFLRGLVRGLASQHIEKVDLTKYTENEAFPPFLINEGKGFKIVPAEYADKDYYEIDNQYNPPVLWCHFTDMAKILNKMRLKKNNDSVSTCMSTWTHINDLGVNQTLETAITLASGGDRFYEHFPDPNDPEWQLFDPEIYYATFPYGVHSFSEKFIELDWFNETMYYCHADAFWYGPYKFKISNLPESSKCIARNWYLLTQTNNGQHEYNFGFNYEYAWGSYGVSNNSIIGIDCSELSLDWPLPPEPVYWSTQSSVIQKESRFSAQATVCTYKYDLVTINPGKDECAKDGVYDDCLCGGCGSGVCSKSNGGSCSATTTIQAGGSSSTGDGGQASRMDLNRDTLVASLGGDFAAPGSQPVLKVNAYFTQNTNSAGITSSMFSLDTKITEDMESNSLNFVSLVRANGKQVTFCIVNGVGIPDNGASYRLKKITENEIVRYEVFFPENNTTQHFDADGKLCKLTAEIDGGIRQVQADASGNWPGMTINRNTEGKVTGVVTATGTAEPVLDANGKMTGMRYYNPQNVLYRRTANVEGTESVPPDGTARYIIYREYDGSDNLLKERKVTTYPNKDVKEEIFNITGGTAGTVASTTLVETSVIDDLSLATTTVTRGTSVAVSATRTKAFPWGANTVESIVAPGTSDEKTTIYNYYEDKDTDGDNYGKLKSQINPDGSWTRYEYDSDGRTIKVVTPVGNADVDVADSSCRVTTYSYAPVAPGLTPVPGDTRARTIVTSVLGTEVSRQYNEYFVNEEVNIVCKTAGAAWDASSNIVTHKYSYSSGDFKGKLRKIANPDGTMSVYTYAITGGNLETIIKTGSGSGDTVASGTSTVKIVNAAGYPVSNTVVDIASGLTLSSETYTLDDFGRITRTDYLGGTYSTTEYGCCGPISRTAQDGSVTTMAYTALTQLDHTATAGITTFYSYNAHGNTVATIIKGTDNTEKTTTNVYNDAGELVSTTTPDNKTTAYAESWADGFRYKTTTYPNSSTRIEKYNADGSLAEVSGTAVHPVKYEYGVESGELYTKVILVGDEGATSQWQKTFYDMTGNAYKTVYSDNSSSQIFYDAVNRPVKQVSPSGVVNLTAYNSDGDVSASAVDMNRNDSIDYSGPDRVTGYGKSVTTRSSVTVRRNVTSVYQSSSSTPTEASVNEVSADGLKSWQTSFGRTSSSQTTLSGGGARSVVTTNPDNSTVTSVYQDGRITSSTHSVLGVTYYFYDAFNRLSSTTHTENGVEKSTEYAYNDAGQTTSVTENPGNRVTSYTYDDMGRRTSVTYPGSRTVNYTYATTGEALTVSGADTYPQAFTYDAQGRMKTLTTYKAYPGTPEVTTWNYDSSRGFMVSKVYPDNKQVTYTNDADGKMLTRVWSRGITTTYSYDNGGSLTGVSYSDGTTPAVSYTLDRMGRVTAVTDASGSRTLTYNADGTLANETIPYIVNGAVEYTYDSLGRRTGLQLNQNSTAVFANSYTYDSMSRLATVSDGTNTATYSRVSGGNLLNTTTIAQGGNTKLTTTRNYDSQNRLTSISSAAGTITKTYSYTYDDKDRRSRLDLADGSYWLYSYDTKGQIISGVKYASGGAPIPGQSFTYNYDDIGNLTTEQRGMTEMQFSYTANLVNQYTQRLVPGIIPIIGQASTDSTVSIWLKNHGENAAAVIKPTRSGEYFTSLISVDNTNANVSEDLEITAVKFDTAQDKDVVKTITGNYTVPKTPQLFTYDDDGNVTGDGVWSYTWNGENRLVKTEKDDKVKIETEYDYSGRRVSKKSYSWVNSTWQLDKYLKFAYNGFKLVAEYDGTTGNLLRCYCWNGDKLEWMMSGSTVYYYVIDGNKNVTALIDSTGALVAEYEYGQFGEILSKNGAMADINPFRFSSEYYDSETGLIYYNYRYYSPDLRRWLSRDPIDEKGGKNLYGFVGNNSVLKIDDLGLLVEDTSKSKSTYKLIYENKYPSLKGTPCTNIGEYKANQVYARKWEQAINLRPDKVFYGHEPVSNKNLINLVINLIMLIPALQNPSMADELPGASSTIFGTVETWKKYKDQRADIKTLEQVGWEHLTCAKCKRWEKIIDDQSVELLRDYKTDVFWQTKAYSQEYLRFKTGSTYMFFANEYIWDEYWFPPYQ